MPNPITAVWPGKPFPQGATWDGEGVNFALFSEHAEGVELCLFDSRGRRELQRIPLREQTDQVWHCYLPEARPGQLYGYRVYGPYQPQQGHRFNPHKLLLDPYAKAIVGSLAWSDAHFGYRIGSQRADLSQDRRNNASGMPKCQVIDPAFSWGDDRNPRTPWHDTVIYEMHVRGFTKLHPRCRRSIAARTPGSAPTPVIEYLQAPRRHRGRADAGALVPQRPAPGREGPAATTGATTRSATSRRTRTTPSSLQADREFKTMVKALHSAGIEVILDVVYNHTAEGNHLGPTLCFRGIDNAAYYRLVHDDPRYYMDYTGCGNTLNMLHPRVLQMIMDSLRYWITEMHVDGFRFDLAAALARELHEVDRLGAFFDIIHQDPVISQVKLIAEPWDLGEGGYQVGRFPVGWTEWNGKYRDVIRDYWKGEGGLIGDLAYRVAGSSDLYEHSGRRPYASVNFVTAHDGFTLRDLVSYNEKHNEANKDDNRDGENHNRSWNCGAEGPTDDPEIRALRLRQSRNLLASLLLSQGVPMLLAGDEFGHSQQGNNNAYCQDNELTWLSWEIGEEDGQLLEFVREPDPPAAASIACSGGASFSRTARSAARTCATSSGSIPPARRCPTSSGATASRAASRVFLSGRGLDERDERGRTIVDNDFLVLVNAHYETVEFKLPAQPEDARWVLRVDTTQRSLRGRRSARSRRATATRCRDERWRCSSFRSRARSHECP